MWLQWNQAAIASACLAVFGVAGRQIHRRWMAGGAAVCREAALILALYALWQKMGALAVTHVNGAMSRARSIWHVERVLHLPSEVSLQHAFLPHPLLVQAANAYYAIVHVPALIVFLIWLFVRHRDRYARWRNVGALLTGVSLLIQMVPVAPPRLVPGLGFVDTAVAYGQSVYGPGGISVAPQLSAMPSVHVGWAALIALAVIATSTSRWRWFVLLHPLLTVMAVTVTANHWWLDGAVSVGLLALGVAVVWSLGLLGQRLRAALGQAAAIGRPPVGARGELGTLSTE
jgi:hypothetical protein